MEIDLGVRQLQTKKEGEPLHIVSPSTIPLTLWRRDGSTCAANLSLPKTGQVSQLGKARIEKPGLLTAR